MKLNDIQGSTSQRNIDTLQKYAKLSVGGKTLIADIGTCAGKSAIALAVADPNIFVLTVDPLDSPHLFEVAKEFGVEKRITFYKVTSEEFGKQCPELDMCFIDGVHNYTGIKTDVENIVSKVKKGGYVLFHDCNLYSDTVRVAVEEFNGKEYEFIEEVGGRTEDPKEGSVWVGRRM